MMSMAVGGVVLALTPCRRAAKERAVLLTKRHTGFVRSAASYRLAFPAAALSARRVTLEVRAVPWACYEWRFLEGSSPLLALTQQASPMPEGVAVTSWEQPLLHHSYSTLDLLARACHHPRTRLLYCATIH